MMWPTSAYKVPNQHFMFHITQHQRPSPGHLLTVRTHRQAFPWTKGGRQPVGRSTADWHVSSWCLDEKYCSFGIYPSLVLFGLCPASMPQQSEAIRLPLLLRRPKLCGWKILLLPGRWCFIMGITVLVRPQTGFPRFCYHNTVWLWFFSFALCNHVFHKIEPVLH